MVIWYQTMPHPSSPDEAAPAGAAPAGPGPDLFAQLVTGHAQMALTFLGKVDNPQTGRPDGVNMEAAKVFIDQLEMLRSKTRGNLDAEETRLLAQVSEVVRTAFVEVDRRRGLRGQGWGVPNGRPGGTSLKPAAAGRALRP